MIVEEGSRKFNVDEETGLVTEAVEDYADEFRIGDRVQVDEETGTIISITASVYGPAFGVRFDDGGVDEYPELSLKRATVEEPEYESPLAEILARFEAYEKLPSITNDELATKEKEARLLNLQARSLITDSKLAFNDQNALGKVVLVTSGDLEKIKELREHSQESQEYLGKFNRYKISETLDSGAVLGMKGDASWLESALDGMEVEETTDADLAARAVEVVSSFSKGQLEDEEFMTLAATYHHEYLQMDDDRAKKFDALLARARQERLKNIPGTEKEASAEDDITDFDASALYL